MTTAADEAQDLTRLGRLRDGVRQLRVGTAGLNWNERALMIIGGVLAPLGVIAVLLGWYGAARTPNTFEQIPYMISGGLLGLGLIFLGAFFYFTHWVTELVKESRAQSAAVLDAIRRLEEAIGRAAVSANGHREHPVPADEPIVALVATERGSMAHRETCSVVVGKSGLRPVSADDALEPCKLCDPYAVDDEARL